MNNKNPHYAPSNPQNKKYIYGYIKLPILDEKNPIIKIGETTNADINGYIEGIINPRNTSNNIQWIHAFKPIEATYSGGINKGKSFSDHDLRPVFEFHDYPRLKDINGKLTEEHRVPEKIAEYLINEFKKGIPKVEMNVNRTQTFEMRPEQQDAVNKTKEYFDSRPNGTEMLWNAKMRFGKTFTAYQLAKPMNFKKILVVTYKPAVKDAWKTDLNNHEAFKDFVFLADEDLLAINNYKNNSKKVVAFVSFQDILQEGMDENIKERHKYLFGENNSWDFLIIDEFHYGSSTKRAKEVMSENFGEELKEEEIKKNVMSEEQEEEIEEKELQEIEKKIKSKYKLFLSGTPFKALADDRFLPEAIFNWTYQDEQKAKEEWVSTYSGEKNPYESLPKIEMYLLELSKELINAGWINEKNEFSLNEFFKVEKGHDKFKNEDFVIKWLDLLSGNLENKRIEDEISEDQEKINDVVFPFSNKSEFIKKGLINHTMWYLNRTSSAKALKKLLEEHPRFKDDYKIILVAGKDSKSGADALPPVKEAIKKNKKTIILTVGKLTTGVSIPELSAVLFLRDTESPESYFQTAFRAQTPHIDSYGKVLKEKCYIFDFSPNRSLKLLTEYSEKLSNKNSIVGSSDKMEEFIKYLPVLKFSGNSFVQMDAKDVLTFNYQSIGAKTLGEYFGSTKNVHFPIDKVIELQGNQILWKKCEDIFERIKQFKKFNSIKQDEGDKLNVKELGRNASDIQKLKTKGPNKTEKDTKEINEKEKEYKEQANRGRELLKTLLARLPVYMYLTDASEENLIQVLNSDIDNIFEKTTGITVQDFQFLFDIGFIKANSINGYIYKFLELENDNYNHINEINNSINLG